MKALTRQIAVCGLILLGLCSIAAAVLTKANEMIAIASNVVLGIVGILKQNEDNIK